ncbi:MAG TPA: GNAT family N-acetyltransferase [Ktedonobacterales bacterium]|nr:GNAT family N-acetyltransferase [Ktedonobacterales bacterium]HEX5571455.1 GNAT family N-acetyltransferase [Ktedonobacterales bacterium]
MPSAPFTIAPLGSDAARFEQATDQTFEQALATLRDGLGAGFITREGLLRYVAPDAPDAREPFRSALAATDDATGAVIGALTMEIVDTESFQTSFLHSYDLARADETIARLASAPTGLIKSIAVAPSARGRGVATGLIGAGMRALAERGARRYYSLAWVNRQRGCQLCGVLAALGFHSALRIERFWYRDSLASGYRCPACDQPCECAVEVMVR